MDTLNSIHVLSEAVVILGIAVFFNNRISAVTKYSKELKLELETIYNENISLKSRLVLAEEEAKQLKLDLASLKSDIANLKILVAENTVTNSQLKNIETKVSTVVTDVQVMKPLTAMMYQWFVAAEQEEKEEAKREESKKEHRINSASNMKTQDVLNTQQSGSTDEKLNKELENELKDLENSAY